MLRYRYRLLILVAVAALFLLGYSVPALSPLVAAATLVGNPAAVSWTALAVALLLAVACAWRRRFICHTVCPLGFCFDGVGKLRRKTTGSNRPPRFLRNFPKFGTVLALFTLLGVGVGVAGFLWLDPFVLFGSLFQGGTPLLPLTLLLLVATWSVPTFWCHRVCPLGGMQDLLYWPRSMLVRRRGAATLTQEQPAATQTGRRRMFVAGLLFGGMAVLFESLRRATAASASAAVIRPPGAVDEPLFTALCCRCGACQRACPTRLLRSGDARAPLRWGTPRARFDPAWCRDDCTACTEICPSGALSRVTLEQKPAVKMGLAVLQFEYCRLYDDRECSICGRECPFDAISYEWSEEEYRRVPVVDAELCTGCGRCVVVCPVGRDDEDDAFAEGHRPLTVASLLGPARGKPRR